MVEQQELKSYNLLSSNSLVEFNANDPRLEEMWYIVSTLITGQDVLSINRQVVYACSRKFFFQHLVSAEALLMQNDQPRPLREEDVRNNDFNQNCCELSAVQLHVRQQIPCSHSGKTQRRTFNLRQKQSGLNFLEFTGVKSTKKHTAFNYMYHKLLTN